MKIVNQKISTDRISEFGLIELMNVYKNNKKQYPEDWIAYTKTLHALKWDPDTDWYIDKESLNWVFAVTHFKTYLLYYNGKIYEIKFYNKTHDRTQLKDVMEIKDCYYLKSIKTLMSKELWDITPVKQFHVYWKSFVFNNGIPYETKEIEALQFEEIKNYFEEALFQTRMIDLEFILKRRKKATFQIKLSLEIK